jgi:hypothetical protein
MYPLVVVAWFYLLIALVCTLVLNVYEICLKLKFGIRITWKFSTIQKLYSCIYSILAMDGPSNATKHERFGGGAYFRRWSFSLHAWGEGWAVSLSHCRCEVHTRYDHIRFLDSAFMWPLKTIRLWFVLPHRRSASSTLTVYFVYFSTNSSTDKPNVSPCIL